MFKKIISILLCACLTAVFVGCDNHENAKTQNKELTETVSESEIMATNGCETQTNSDETDVESDAESTSEKAEYEIDKELMAAFEMLYKDAEEIDKIEFYVEHEDLYYDYKNSGRYDNSNWHESFFELLIRCDYSLAVNEEWYKQCTETDMESLNKAFINQYNSGFTNGTYKNISFVSGTLLYYSSLERFYMDYSNIKALADLGYITKINITYQYGLPNDYYIEPVINNANEITEGDRHI